MASSDLSASEILNLHMPVVDFINLSLKYDGLPGELTPM